MPEEAKIDFWRAEGLVLQAPDGVATVEQLYEFAKRARDKYPEGVCTISEFALRVTEYSRNGFGPYLDWRD